MPPPNPYPSLCSSATPRRTTPSPPISTQPSSTPAAMAALQPTLSFKPSTNMLTSGFAPRGHILNRLIDLYFKASYFRYAKKLFDEIPEPDVVARTTLIAAYSASGDPKLAREVFDGTPLEIRDIVCYNCWNWCPRMSDNESVPSPPMKDFDHLFGPSEIGPKFAYEARIRRKIISNNDMFPEWTGHVRRLRACELEEGGSLCNHILEMMNYMNKLEYLDTNFDRNLVVPLLLRSLPDSYNDFLWKNHYENKSKTWIEIINELRRYEEDKITQKGKLEEEKGKEKRK
ncbi:hypothetical protein OROMI_014558 [Orobanche minor]